MRILMLTQLFQPEPNHLKGLAFARELMRQGHSVEVLTGFPNYPGGKIYPGYRMRGCMRETLDGVPVVRVPLFPSHNSSGLLRMLNYSSFALSAALNGVARVQQPDVVHVYQGPATLAWPAMLLRRRYRTPFVLDVQDLWPDSVASSGMLKVPGGLKILDRWCQHTYRKASRLVVLSEGYKNVLVQRGVPAAKISVVYNWSDESCADAADADSSCHDPFELNGHFNIVFAGNMGRLQALDTVITAAAVIEQKFPHVKFVFVGDGVDVERLKELVHRSRLSNVRFLPRQPVSRMRDVFHFANALLIHLQDDATGRVGIPQKTQAYLAAGRPIIMAVRGNAADLVRRAEAGVLCQPGDPQSIAQAVQSVVTMSAADRHKLGSNGRRFYEAELCFRVGVNRMMDVFDRAVRAAA